MYIINEWETPAVYLVNRSASVITSVNTVIYYVPFRGNSYVCKSFLPLFTRKWSQLWEWGVSLFVYMYLSVSAWRGHNTVIYDTDPLASLDHSVLGKLGQFRRSGSSDTSLMTQLHNSFRILQIRPEPILLVQKLQLQALQWSNHNLAALISYLFLPQAMCFTFIWLMELLSRHLATTRKTTHFSATHTLTRMQHALLIKNPWLCLEPLHYIISWQLRILWFLEGKFLH